MPTQSQPTALPKHTVFSPAPWRTVPTTSRPGGKRLDIVTDSLAFAPSFVAGDIMPSDAAHIVHCVNTHPALVAENERLREALEDCNGVLDSINRQLGGKSVAVRAVLDKARAALATEDV